MSLSGEVFDLRQISPFEAEILAGGGEMGAFMRSFDWSSSPLGPVAGWPQSLRTAVSLCLNARFASCIFWGPDLIMLYNDGCRQMIASKHPGALGHPGREGWPEIWHIIGPRLQSVLDTGQATWSEDFPLLLERNGYLEECYLTFSLSPIRDETGRVGGIFTPATETTEKVIEKRRLRTLRDLAACTAQAKEAVEAGRIAVETLATNPYDIPFALLYVLDDDRKRARLVGTAGLAPGTPASPHVVELGNLEEPPQGWPLAQVARTGQAELVDALEQQFGALPGGAWPVAPQSAVVLPITLAGQELPSGLLVAALSPRKAVNDDYRAFSALVAQQIATSMAKARVAEESGVEGLEAGVEDYLIKPFSARELLTRTGAHLEMVRLRQETARREQELRAEAEAAQARVASILESITDGFFAVNYQWQFTYINQKAEQLLQKRRDEIFSKNLWEEFPEAVSSIFFEHCHKAASQRVAVEFEFEGFYPLLNIWFEVHVYPSHDGLSVYFHDITARKRAEEALKESEERYRDLFENASDLIQSVGPDGHFVYVNWAWREALRYTEAEISHLSFLDIISPKSHAHCIDIFQGVMAGEKIDKVEAVFVTKDGKEIAVEGSINCRFVNGKPTATRGIFRDITERKRAEAALQEVNAALRQSNEALRHSNEYLNQLAYAVSHDLQESLRMVIVYSQLLKKRYQGSLDGNADQFIADLVEGAQRMKMLLKDLLEYSRVANASEQPSAPVDCNAALQQALSNLGAAIKQSRATITSDHLPTVRAHDTHLLQLFQNLVGNALKYRSKEPPRIQVSAKQEETEWVFAVQDNGIGIDPQYTKQVFGIFTRLHGHKYPGTGIGLAICQKIVERYGGRIWVESALGKGSTFYFTIRI